MALAAARFNPFAQFGEGGDWVGRPCSELGAALRFLWSSSHIGSKSLTDSQRPESVAPCNIIFDEPKLTFQRRHWGGSMAGHTMGRHMNIAVGARGGIKSLPTWQVTEPITGCLIGSPDSNRDAAVKSARLRCSKHGGNAAMAANIKRWHGYYAKASSTPKEAK